jgi:hypothetical protein
MPIARSAGVESAEMLRVQQGRAVTRESARRERVQAL